MKNFKYRLCQLLNTYCAFVKWHKFFSGNYYFFRFVWFKFLGLVLGYSVLYLFRKNINRQDKSHGYKEEISFEEATQSDYDAIMRLNSNRPDNFIRERLENREICYVARAEDGKFLSYFWVAPGERTFGYRAKKIFVKNHDVYIRDVMTLPEQRGHGITPKFLEWIALELSNKGKKSMWAAITGLNFSSQRAFKKAGFCIDKEIHFFCLPLMKKDIVFCRRKKANSHIMVR